jgi:hypothetical protein
MFGTHSVKHQNEHDSVNLAFDYVQQHDPSTELQGPAIHKNGWPYWTVARKHDWKPNPNAAVVSGLPGVSFSTVATIYEIDVPDGETAQQVYDTWHADQDRIEKETRNTAIAQSKADFNESGLQEIGQLAYDYKYDSGFQWRLGDNFIQDVLNDLVPPLALDGKVEFGTVRITIERVESATDET